MVRNVVLVELRPDADPPRVAAIQDGFRGLDPPGCLAYTLGDDLGLREGNWSFAIVADFTDVDAYRAYDADPEHNRLRGELAPLTARIGRVQFTAAEAGPTP